MPAVAGRRRGEEPVTAGSPQRCVEWGWGMPDKSDRNQVRSALREYDRIARLRSKVLPTVDIRRRAALLRQLCVATGQADPERAVEMARDLVRNSGMSLKPMGVTPRSQKKNKASQSREVTGIGPGLAAPRPYDAKSVRSVVPGSFESNRRRH
jgi:hypothetical protein